MVTYTVAHLTAIGKGWGYDQQSPPILCHANHTLVPALGGGACEREEGEGGGGHTLITLPLPILNLKDLSEEALLSKSCCQTTLV